MCEPPRFSNPMVFTGLVPVAIKTVVPTTMTTVETVPALSCFPLPQKPPRTYVADIVRHRIWFWYVVMFWLPVRQSHTYYAILIAGRAPPST